MSLMRTPSIRRLALTRDTLRSLTEVLKPTGTVQPEVTSCTPDCDQYTVTF